jgi:TatA/E family protein of Tat protein translocase
MFDVGGGELILILLAVIVLFGPKKLPEIAQTMGKGLRQFRKAQQEIKNQFEYVQSEIEEHARVAETIDSPAQKADDATKSPIEAKELNNRQFKPIDTQLKSDIESDNKLL